MVTVISSVREPMAGWVDNWNGPTGIIAAAGKGFFRTMLCHENKIADLVPVDVVINLMICAAWRTATTRYIWALKGNVIKLHSHSSICYV